MKQLNIRDVTNGIQKRQETRLCTFVKVLEKCYMKIERTAASDSLFVFYEVPMFVLGCPLFNVNDCIAFMKENLEKNGFLVKYYFPNIIYISWNKEEIKEHKLNQDLQKAKELDNLLMGSSSGGGGGAHGMSSARGSGMLENHSQPVKKIGTRGRGGGGGGKNKIILNLM